jgi:nucleotide-binding universal stress UspA family protein
MIVLNNILVATDFSESSEAALAYGRALARQFGATLHVLHVVEDFAARFVGFPFPVGDLGRMQTAAESTARERLNAMLSGQDRQALQAKAVVIMSTSPSEAILDYARHTMPRIELVVMGTHGRGAVGHLFMGSVAERVVRSAPCPVLTIRHPEREFIAPDALQAVARA